MLSSNTHKVVMSKPECECSKDGEDQLCSTSQSSAIMKDFRLSILYYSLLPIQV